MVLHGGIIAVALELTEDEGYAQIAAETKLAPPEGGGLQVRALSTDEEFDGTNLVARPELAEKLAQTEAVRTIQVRAITTSVPASELALSDED